MGVHSRSVRFESLSSMYLADPITQDQTGCAPEAVSVTTFAIDVSLTWLISIPCSSCQKNKGHNQYSNKQLNDLRHKVKRQGGGKIDAKNSVRCRECTGSQPQEMYCIECREIKELKKFALAQRKHPDNAVCIALVAVQVADGQRNASCAWKPRS